MDPIGIGRGLGISDAVAEKPQTGASPASRFSDALRNAVDDVSRLQQTADKAIKEVQTGNTGSLHEAMIALEKADISFRTMLQFRNRFIEAYQEVMRLQV
jgi:flagellar hook-basal body complex protein FliE